MVNIKQRFTRNAQGPRDPETHGTRGYLEHGSLNVPMFHITQPLGIWSINVYFMATIFGDVQYSQVMGHLPTPVEEMELQDEEAGCEPEATRCAGIFAVGSPWESEGV